MKLNKCVLVALLLLVVSPGSAQAGWFSWLFSFFRAESRAVVATEARSVTATAARTEGRVLAGEAAQVTVASGSRLAPQTSRVVGTKAASTPPAHSIGAGSGFRLQTSSLSKVTKAKKTELIGGGKYIKTTKIKPGNKPGQSRAEFVVIKNAGNRTIKTYKDSYDRGNRFQHRKPLTGGPEGRKK